MTETGGRSVCNSCWIRWRRSAGSNGSSKRRQILDQLITIQPLIEQLSLTKPLPLRTQMPIALQQLPMLLQVGQKNPGSGRSLRHRDPATVAPRHSVVHRPDRPNATCRARTTASALQGGVSPPGAAHGDRPAAAPAAVADNCAKAGKLVHIGTVDGQGWAGFTHRRPFFWLPPRGDHGQTLQQGGGRPWELAATHQRPSAITRTRLRSSAPTAVIR